MFSVLAINFTAAQEPQFSSTQSSRRPELMSQRSQITPSTEVDAKEKRASAAKKRAAVPPRPETPPRVESITRQVQFELDEPAEGLNDAAASPLQPFQLVKRQEDLPPSKRRYEVQPGGQVASGKTQISKDDKGLITLVAPDQPLIDVLNDLAQQEQISYVHASRMEDRVSISLRGVTLEDALTALLSAGGYTWIENRGIVYISSLDKTNKATPEYSGRTVRVFPLDYASAQEVSKAIQGMLSPVGSSYTMISDSADNRKTAETVIVEDLPGSISRIEQYILQVDVPPRQVLIEAHVLEVRLKETEKHGVNFEHLAKLHNHQLRLGTLGVAPTGTSTFVAEISSDSLNGLIEALKTMTDAKTLAQPKILALNGQQARLQVGQQLGFPITTQTQTSTIQDVRMLDLGIVLQVTPQISRDGRIMMHVKPKVSSGLINSSTNLPEEETSEVETSVLLSNGKGMIIGGLIQEKDALNISQVPRLGNLRVLGHLFKNRQVEKTRSEIIFVLIPRIIEPGEILSEQERYECIRAEEQQQLDIMRATTPLFDQHLQPNPSADYYDLGQTQIPQQSAQPHRALNRQDTVRPVRFADRNIAQGNDSQRPTRSHAVASSTISPQTREQTPVTQSGFDRGQRSANSIRQAQFQSR